MGRRPDEPVEPRTKRGGPNQAQIAARARAEERARKEAQQRRRQRNMLTTCGLAAIFLAATTFYLKGGSLAGLVPDGPGLPTSILDDPNARDIGDLTSNDVRQLNRQRAIVHELARRYVGPSLNGSLNDLRILQDILKEARFTKEQTYELQAIGVALGDVMAKNLDLKWVVVDDRYGRSRALQHGDRADLVFPVTLISKRMEAGQTIYVDQIYEKIASTVRRFRRS